MAGYRQIHTKIWKDGWFLDLCAADKLLFIYLFSNDRANLAGLYDLPVKVIVFETELTKMEIRDGLRRFEKQGKAHYEDGWVWIPNLLRYNAANVTSPKIQQHLKTTLEAVPDIPLKARWIEHYNGIVQSEYRIDTVSIPNSESGSEQEQEQEHDLEHEHDQDHEQEQDKDYAANAAPPPPTPPPKAKSSPKPKPAPLTEGQRGFLAPFGAKRYKTVAQREAVLVMEKEHGTAKLLEAATWAAERGMSVGAAVGAVRSALPNWGQKKPQNKGSPVGDPFEQGIRELYAEGSG